MAITLNREAYNEFRCFGMPDDYPKDIRDAVSELRRRGYGASLALLQYLVEERLVTPRDDRWTEADIDDAARELDEREAYTSEAMYFLHLGVDAAGYFRALHEAWDRVRDEFGDAATPVNPNSDCFIMTVHPPRFSRDGYVEFTLCDDARRDLEAERQKAVDEEERGTLSELDREKDARHVARSKQYDEDLKASEDAVAEARKEWQEALDEAARKRAAIADEAKPGRVKGIGDLEGLDLEGMADRKLSVQGTFNAMAVRGFGGGGPMERVAKASEDTAKNTKDLLREAKQGGLVFA